MITLPDFDKAFEYENNFLLSCDVTRISKLIAHYELLKMTSSLPGCIVECGVFKGTALVTFAMMREILNNSQSRKIIGFDFFGKFPETEYEDDKPFRERFIEEAGDESISVEQLQNILYHKMGGGAGVELVAGDISLTVPEYVKAHPELRISFLNLDVDIYEPSVVILEHLFPLIVKGGVLLLDDYGKFPGETNAFDEYAEKHNLKLERFPFRSTPAFLVKG